MTNTQKHTNAPTLNENAIPVDVIASIIQAFTEIENITYRGSMTDDERESLTMCSTIFWNWIDGQMAE
ncbi:MAG: hypothetical protein J6D09_07940 [Clostridia bacterium]|nr:hypothetical protein [Clostridia bacterium]